MIKKALTIFVIALTIFACKDTQPKTEKSEPQNNVAVENHKVPKKLILEIDLETNVVEDVKLIVSNVFLNNGQFMDLYITQKRNSNESSKKITFELLEGIKPDLILGVSLGPKKIKEGIIKYAKLSYGDLNYDIATKDINKYFRTNKFITIDEETGAFKTKKVDGKHNPVIFLRKQYIEKIK